MVFVILFINQTDEKKIVFAHIDRKYFECWTLKLIEWIV